MVRVRAGRLEAAADGGASSHAGQVHSCKQSLLKGRYVSMTPDVDVYSYVIPETIVLTCMQTQKYIEARVLT